MPAFYEGRIALRHPQVRSRRANPGARAIIIVALLAGAYLGNILPATAACADSPHAGVDWTGCDKRHLHLKGEDLSAAALAGADLSRSDFLEATLRRAVLSGANLSRTRFDSADLRDADLSKAHAYRAQFRGTDLSRARLEDADFQRADFAKARLIEAVLADANLQEASFREANLQHANLRGSNLMRADLRGADLAGADLAGANLYHTRMEGVDLSGARGIAATQIAESCGDKATKLPDAILAPSRWPCLAGD